MIHCPRCRLPEYVYPVEPWRLVQTRLNVPGVAMDETLFATANGYLGLRGTFDEGRPAGLPGSYINGFYESWPIPYGEEAFGFARTGQTLVPVPDVTTVRLYVDDEPLFLPTARLEGFERALDLREGCLDRRLVWRTPAGRRVSVASRRLVSLEHRHVAAIAYEVVLESGGEAPVALIAEVTSPERQPGLGGADGDPRRLERFHGRILRPRLHRERERRLMLAFATPRSDLRLACGVEHVVETECEHEVAVRCGPHQGQLVLTARAREGCPIRLTRFAAYHTSRSAPPEELAERADRTLDRVAGRGFAELRAGQRRLLDDFWERSDVRVGGDPEMQQALRFNLFHVHQATARAEGVGVPAKGLTGDGYEGHYFWDTEIYLMPFLLYTDPRIARNLLQFRYSMLDAARRRAREVNQKGALFPWRTINGEEASAYYAAGTAQYHINADIVHALKKYVDVTGDLSILEEGGAEMLVETARLWRDLGFFSARRGGRFCIHGVTGPDEYNTVVDNNTYTNLMARQNLQYASRVVETLGQAEPPWYRELLQRTGLEASEVEAWRRAAERMYVPFDPEEGIHPQDDDFLFKEPWDFANTPPERYPLLLHHHPLVIYRHQVIKQADVVLAMFLLGSEFSQTQKRRNFDFYDPLTTGDSSLSSCIQAIVAAEVGYPDQALAYARHAALMDLADLGGNVAHGCHIASMGGTWMAVVHGFAGMRDHEGVVSFRPRLPDGVESVGFALLLRGQRLEVEVLPDATTYRLRDGGEVSILHEGEEVRLTAAEPRARRPNAKGGPPPEDG